MPLKQTGFRWDAKAYRSYAKTNPHNIRDQSIGWYLDGKCMKCGSPKIRSLDPYMCDICANKNINSDVIKKRTEAKNMIATCKTSEDLFILIKKNLDQTVKNMKVDDDDF